MSTELKGVLLKKIEADFHKECCTLETRLDNLRSLLLNIAKNGSWRLPMTIRGMDTRFPEYEKDLALLERCGLLKSKVKFTEHNSYKVYEVSEEGAAFVKGLV